MKTPRVLWLFLCLFCVSSPGQEHNPARQLKADSRVRTVLEELSFSYEMTAQNNFKLKPLPVSSGRTHLAYVNSDTRIYGKLEMREVLAPAFLANGPLPGPLANRLLRENSETTLGAWRVLPIDEGANAGKYLVLYAIHITANSEGETLRLALKDVTQAADALEKELTGKDSY